ncbi:hypothetical protein M2109_002730 [Paenibacillus sp. PastH-3]|nr:hypothetical protein [Paenibacillus sp. PastH-4]MDH6444516.1 hypothetical protein [Paenibacillus sp. PastF-4]MDH6528413.1 hypothetical protein [Paenibacillus sp. PastH-3]
MLKLLKHLKQAFNESEYKAAILQITGESPFCEY